MKSYSKYILLILLFISNYKSLMAQNTEGINYGFACKTTVELLKARHKSAWVNWRFAICGSLSYTKNIRYNNYWMPQVHGDLVLMQGGVGTSDIDKLREKGNVFKRLYKRKINMFLAGTFVPAFYGYKVNQNSEISRTYMGKPLYYFSDFTYPVLKNPFLAHLSLGTSIVYNYRANVSTR